MDCATTVFDDMPSISIVDKSTNVIVKDHVKVSTPPKSDIKKPLNQTESNETSPSPSFIEKTKIDPTVWVMAPEFVPQQQQIQYTDDTDDDNDNEDNITVIIDQPSIKSYAQVVGCSNLGIITPSDNSVASTSMMTTLCPYIRPGESICVYGEQCQYEHGSLCEFCECYCLDPNDINQQKKHRTECIQRHENNMELAFAVKRSRDKSCGICFEVIMEKQREQRFGILPNCNHIFCLECIRKWRQEKQFDTKIIRACPECRTTSDYVCPSSYWVDTKDDKDKLLSDYKKALESKHCKYYKQGDGTCPFGNKCFYKHALPNGDIVDVGLPNNRRQNRFVELWDFVNHRNNQFFDDLASLFAEAEEYEFSELEEFESNFALFS